MNKNILRVVSCMLLLTLALGVPVTNAQTASGEPIEIFMRVAAGEFPPPDPANWWWPEYVREQTGVDVTVTFALTNEDLIPMLNARAAANDLPDLMLMNDGRLRPLFVEFAEQGLLADWAPYLESIPTFVELRATPEVRAFGEINGALYGLPARGAGPFVRAMVAIRQDWLEKLNLEVPTTLDEYLAVATAFTEQDPDGNGQNDTFGWSGFFDPTNISNPLVGFFSLYGAYNALGTWRETDGALEFIPATTDRRDALAFIHRMYEAGVIDPDFATLDGNSFGTRWKTGRIGIINSDFCATLCPSGYTEFAAANPEGRLVVIDPPVGPNGASANGSAAVGATVFAMSQKAVDEGKAESIATFLDWLAGDGYVPTLYGLEGQHHEVDETGRITPLQQDQFPQPGAMQMSTLAQQGSETEMRQRYDFNTEHENGATINPLQILQQVEAMPYTNLTDFQLLPTADQAGLSSADLFRFIAENELAFMTGQRSLDEWDQYVEELNNNFGLQQWVEAAQAAADEQGILTN
jgi:putative aldouronate transport system substrate-binding protein